MTTTTASVPDARKPEGEKMHIRVKPERKERRRQGWTKFRSIIPNELLSLAA